MVSAVPMDSSLSSSPIEVLRDLCWLALCSLFCSGNRRQLLFIEGKTILAFVTQGSKFADCSSFTEVTSQVDCKVGILYSFDPHFTLRPLVRLWLTWRLSDFLLPAALKLKPRMIWERRWILLFSRGSPLSHLRLLLLVLIPLRWMMLTSWWSPWQQVGEERELQQLVPKSTPSPVHSLLW